MPILMQFTALRSNAKIIPAPAIALQLDRFTRAWCEDVILSVRPYPPAPPPPNRYVRTGRLGNFWRLRAASDFSQVKYIIDNPVQDKRGRYYVNYVHGPTGQTSFHSAHGWRNIGGYRNREDFRIGVQSIIQSAGGVAF